MWKALCDRAIYALIGALAGALVGALLWWLYGLGASVRQPSVGMLGGHGHLSTWMRASALFFGLSGFIVKDRTGDVVGELLNQVFRYESRATASSDVSPRHVVVVLVIVVLGVWYFAHP
jgi:hypothetical protein